MSHAVTFNDAEFSVLLAALRNSTEADLVELRRPPSVFARKPEIRDRFFQTMDLLIRLEKEPQGHETDPAV